MSIKNNIAQALKQNLIPGVVLQIFAAIILAVYFFVPAAQPVYTWFGLLKQEYGYAYSLAATALFGGLVPFVYLLSSRRIEVGRSLLALLCFYIIFWGLKGVEVDFFYRLQGEWFGNGNDLKAIATKVCVDQFLYSAFWAAPSITLSYLWMENNFNWQAWRASLGKTFFFEKIPTVVLSNWLVWIPAVSIVYSMPGELQIPLFNLVLCFWVLMLAILNKKSG